MKTIGVMTSGGDSPGMNTCLRAVVRTGIHAGVRVIGIRRAYQGMIEGDFVELDAQSVSGILNRGGTIIKAGRSEEFMTREGRQKAADQLRKAGIEGLVDRRNCRRLSLRRERVPIVGLVDATERIATQGDSRDLQSCISEIRVFHLTTK